MQEPLTRAHGGDIDGALLRKSSLDKDLSKIERVERATLTVSRQLIAPGLALLFLAFAGLVAGLQISAEHGAVVIVVASVIAGYMALNVGANDVANNVSAAVGARALTLTGALLIAAVFESMGALVAGGDVVETISKGIIDPRSLPDGRAFVWAMMAALLSSALWVNLATYIGAPVSTTHAVVGGVMGAGITAAGLGAVNWPTIGAIAASWVVSPLLGGIIAALFLAFIKINIIYQDDKIAAARRWVPLLIAIMTSAFVVYLITKGLNKVWKPTGDTIAVLALAIFAVSLAALRPWIARQSEGLENRNQSLRALFRVPLILSAAPLSFAHGANDVANAVGPLAAILHSVQSGAVAGKVGVPFWVMLIGASGISLGLYLYGPKLILMVGEQITKMNPMRAFCVALSAAVTVIVASGLGLPVSSTHIAVGAVFGVGFFREFYTAHSKRRRRYVKAHVRVHRKVMNLEAERQEAQRRRLVRRSHFLVIVAAWVITVPCAAGLAAAIYLALDAAM
ncbi:MAG: inorganic phosphate transporter [Pseudomonadota bacterium]